MGFGGFMKGLGKAILPMAAGMIPGAGAFLGPAVGAMMNKGIGPSQPPGMGPQQQQGGMSKFMQGMGGGGGGWQGMLGSMVPGLAGAGINKMMQRGPGPQGGGNRFGIPNSMYPQPAGRQPPIMSDGGQGGFSGQGGGNFQDMLRQYMNRGQQGVLPQRNMRNPNLSYPMEQGRMEARNPQYLQQPTMY